MTPESPPRLTRFRIRPALALLVAVMAATAPRALAQEDAAALPAVTPSFAADEWLGADAQIELTVSPPLAPGAGSLAVFLGTTDMTHLFAISADKLVYRPGTLRLPAGESELIVHFVDLAGQWQEIGRFPIRVRTRAGFETSVFDPKLDLGNEGQVAEGHAPDENAPQRDTYQDLTGNTGFLTTHTRSGWTVRSQLNVVGVSHREKALRFSEKQEDAPRIDLSDYRVDVEKGIATASVGHVSFGGNRHLANSFGSRGVSTTLRFGSRADLTTAWLHGSSIVGWNHFLGVDRREHRMAGTTLGLEAFPARPGALRLEATALTGSLLPVNGFNQGVVNDAEKSRGWGVRLIAATPTQRGRVEAGYSRSRFDNPPDPFLSQGADLVEVRPETRGARYLEGTLNVIPGWAITPSLQGRLSATYRHEQVEPLYRTIAAFVQADRQNHVFELQGGVGEISFQLSHQRGRDNLDEVSSILITRNRDQGLSISFPVSFLLQAESRPFWLPNLNYRYQRTHQQGDGVPDNAGSRPTFVPDQVSAVHGIGLDWQHNRWRASYRFDRSSQDNRQPEREQADNVNRSQNVNFGFTPIPSISLGLDLALDHSENKEIDQTDRTRRVGVSADWNATGSLSIGGRWSMTKGDDDADLRERDSNDLSAQVAQRLDAFRIAGWSLPGQLFLRFGRQASSSLDREFDSQDSRNNWTLNTGLNFTLF